MYDHTFSKLANHQISHQAAQSGLSAWRLHTVTLIFLRGLCRYAWVNILTLSPQSELKYFAVPAQGTHFDTRQENNLQLVYTVLAARYELTMSKKRNSEMDQ